MIFKEGDIVTCIDDIGVDHMVTKGKTYKVVMTSTERYVCVLDKDNKKRSLYTLRFSKIMGSLGKEINDLETMGFRE